MNWEEHRRRERDRENTDLQHHWGSAYEIKIWNGIFRAIRRDDGATVTALTAEQLEAEIRADYRARPVPRDLPAAPPEGGQ